jgi:hypothetical protein
MRIQTLFLTACLLLLFHTTVMAAWQDDFATIYAEKGIDAAVVAALAEGASPEQIIATALPLAGLKKELLLKALFCATAQPNAIQDGAAANGISESTVLEGYQLALDKCSRQMDEKLNSALDTTQQYRGNTSSSRQSRKTNYASPSTIQ